MVGNHTDTLIFDLDNTLIDRNGALRKTIAVWLMEQGMVESTDREAALEKIMVRDNWGYTDRPDFCNWLQLTYGNKAGNETTGHELFDYILNNIAFYVQADMTVLNVLLNLGNHYRLVLATNGNSITQRNKLKQAGLTTLFKADHLFISGEMGHAKPDKRFFDFIIERLSICPPHAMVIGDDPLNDIEAASQCGLKTCWLSHGRQEWPAIRPDIVINEITEITKWLTR